MKKKTGKSLALLLIIILAYLTYYHDDIINYLDSYFEEEILYSYDIGDIPNYSNEKYIYLNDNEPYFNDIDILGKKEFENYSELDSLGRCGVAFANLSKLTMPTEERESIGMIKPSGWQTVKYDNIDGKYLYNRCHLIGFQLAGENSNEKNLITCTRQTNAETMLYFENKVATYIKKTNNHVLYRVTPIFDDRNLVAKGIEIEAYSVEDLGKGIKFNVFIYNVQDGIDIYYETGKSSLTSN